MINGTGYTGVARTTQALGERMEAMREGGFARSSIGRVVASYPKNMTCDIETSNGSIVTNIPILSNCGLEDGEVFGKLEVPSIDTFVIIAHIGDKESFPFILGTLFPYSTNEFQSGQTTVNSADKQFTKKLLEDVSEKVYRKIFRSGTSIEVQEDGTLILETPSGTYITMNETDGKLIIEDQHGNKTTYESAGIKHEDANGNVIEMGSTSVKINNNLEVLQ